MKAITAIAALAILMIVPRPAIASEPSYAYTTNDAGGRIVITGRTSETCNDDMRVAYGTSPKSETIFGCWFHKDGMVHIVWQDGDIRSYPAENFSFR